MLMLEGHAPACPTYLRPPAAAVSTFAKAMVDRHDRRILQPRKPSAVIDRRYSNSLPLFFRLGALRVLVYPP
jgi:hypothetical protein